MQSGEYPVSAKVIEQGDTGRFTIAWCDSTDTLSYVSPYVSVHLDTTIIMNTADKWDGDYLNYDYKWDQTPAIYEVTALIHNGFIPQIAHFLPVLKIPFKFVKRRELLAFIKK